MFHQSASVSHVRLDRIAKLPDQISPRVGGDADGTKSGEHPARYRRSSNRVLKREQTQSRSIDNVGLDRTLVDGLLAKSKRVRWLATTEATEALFISSGDALVNSGLVEPPLNRAARLSSRDLRTL
jgi:hypothetical protein